MKYWVDSTNFSPFAPFNPTLLILRDHFLIFSDSDPYIVFYLMIMGIIIPVQNRQFQYFVIFLIFLNAPDPQFQPLKNCQARINLRKIGYHLDF